MCIYVFAGRILKKHGRSGNNLKTGRIMFKNREKHIKTGNLSGELEGLPPVTAAQYVNPPPKKYLEAGLYLSTYMCLQYTPHIHSIAISHTGDYIPPTPH